MGWQRRLVSAVEAAGASTAEFHRAMQSEGVKGSSYGSVWAYLNKPDAAAPPMEFFEAAGRVLGVRAGWLAFGESPRSGAEWAVSARDAVTGETERALVLATELLERIRGACRAANSEGD